MLNIKVYHGIMVTWCKFVVLKKLTSFCFKEADQACCITVCSLNKLK